MQDEEDQVRGKSCPRKHRLRHATNGRESKNSLPCLGHSQKARNSAGWAVVIGSVAKSKSFRLPRTNLNLSSASHHTPTTTTILPLRWLRPHPQTPHGPFLRADSSRGKLHASTLPGAVALPWTWDRLRWRRLPFRLGLRPTASQISPLAKLARL